MAATKKILTSLHGKLIGLAHDGKLVVAGRTVLTQDDAGTVPAVQGAPSTLNATGTVTAALISAKIITTTAAAEVVATLDTGTAMDTALAATVAIGESVEFSVINTAAAENFILTAAAGHTIVGNPVVPPRSGALFRSRRTAANTWITYSVAVAESSAALQVGALDATGTLTAALMDGGIVTSTAAATVVATLDAGAAMDTALGARVAIGEAIKFTVINTAAAENFVVTASAGHNIVGNPTVAPLSSAVFFSKRTAANTWVTYNASVGEAPVVVQVGALDATGALTAALMDGGVVTSTTAAGVTATVDTGTDMDTALASRYAVGEGFQWSVINTGPNTFTVTAAAAHTRVGAGAVATATSGRFLTKRTAANTWITYRLA